MYDNPRPGRPRVLTPEDEEFIYEIEEKKTHSVDKIIATIEDQCGKKASKSTVRRVIRRRNICGSPGAGVRQDEKKFRQAQEKITREEQRREAGKNKY